MAAIFQDPPKQSDIVGEGSSPNKVGVNWFNWFRRIKQILDFSGLPANQAANLPGISVTITTAALTGAGTQGSMTFTNGILTAQTQAT